jgi:hypothetical protein
MRSSLLSRLQLIQQNAILPLEAGRDMTSPLAAVIGATIMVRDCASSWLNSTRLWMMLSATRRYSARSCARLEACSRRVVTVTTLLANLSRNWPLTRRELAANSGVASSRLSRSLC